MPVASRGGGDLTTDFVYHASRFVENYFRCLSATQASGAPSGVSFFHTQTSHQAHSSHTQREKTR